MPGELVSDCMVNNTYDNKFVLKTLVVLRRQISKRVLYQLVITDYEVQIQMSTSSTVK
jgi:hypothetical protein